MKFIVMRIRDVGTLWTMTLPLIVMSVALGAIMVATQRRFGSRGLWTAWLPSAMAVTAFYAWLSQPANTSMSLRWGIVVMPLAWVPVPAVMTAMITAGVGRLSKNSAVILATAALIFGLLAIAGSYPLALSGHDGDAERGRAKATDHITVDSVAAAGIALDAARRLGNDVPLLVSYFKRDTGGYMVEVSPKSPTVAGGAIRFRVQPNGHYLVLRRSQ